MRRLEGLDVRFAVERPFHYLGHGLGRCHAFGASILTPPGTGALLAQDSC